MYVEEDYCLVQGGEGNVKFHFQAHCGRSIVEGR